MNDYQFPTVHVVRESILNVLELVERSAPAQSPAEIEKLKTEAQETLLALVAHILTADGKYDQREQEFLNRLVDVGSKPNAELGYLRQYTERWKLLEKKIPEFFRIAAAFDAKTRSDTARSVMREIQLIANNSSISDGEFAASELVVIKRYLRFLDEYLDRKLGGREAWLEP